MAQSVSARYLYSSTKPSNAEVVSSSLTWSTQLFGSENGVFLGLGGAPEGGGRKCGEKLCGAGGSVGSVERAREVAAAGPAGAPVPQCRLCVPTGTCPR